MPIPSSAQLVVSFRYARDAGDVETWKLTLGGNGKAGAFFGVLIGSWVMDKYGRKVGVMYCATLSIIGGVCLCAAQNIAMFIVFRFFAGAGSWAFLPLSRKPLLRHLPSFSPPES